MSWYLVTPSHWILCIILSVRGGTATFTLYDETDQRQGRARQTRWGWLVYAEAK